MQQAAQGPGPQAGPRWAPGVQGAGAWLVDRQGLVLRGCLVPPPGAVPLLIIKLTPSDPSKPLGKVQIALQHADRYIPIVPNADQVFEAQARYDVQAQTVMSTKSKIGISPSRHHR